MPEWLDRFKIPIALSFLGIVLIIGGIFTSGLTKQTSKEFPKESLIKSHKQISVDVSGAVKNPGVYSLEDGQRVEEAIKLAGGFSENVNQEYISKSLNLAQKLSDGTKIYIPAEGEMGIVAGASTNNSSININSATQAELESLPGIGPVTASKIISDRPYQAAQDLLNKKVVSKAVYEKIKDLVVVY